MPAAETKAERGYFGFTNRYQETTGLFGQMLVLEVHPGGPAERAGLLPGDVITAVNGVSFRFVNDLDMIRNFDWAKPDTELELQVIRDQKSTIKKLVTAKMPPERAASLARWLLAAEKWYEEGGREACRERRAQSEALQELEASLDKAIEVEMRRSSAGELEWIGISSERTEQLLTIPQIQSLADGVPSGESERLRLYKDEHGRLRVGLGASEQLR